MTHSAQGPSPFSLIDRAGRYNSRVRFEVDRCSAAFTEDSNVPRMVTVRRNVRSSLVTVMYCRVSIATLSHRGD